MNIKARTDRRTMLGAMLGTALVAGNLAPAQAQGTPAATATRVVTDYLGREVEIPANPQRVISLSLPILEIALAVGIKPVGSASFATLDGFPAILADQAEGVELVGDTEFDYEKIIALQPDLAIMDYFGEQDAETLATMEQIVPIVTVGEFRENWRADSAMVAGYLNQREAFTVIEEHYDARVAELTAGLDPDWTGATVALLRFRAGDMRVLKQISFAGTVLGDLGLQFPGIPDSGSGVAEDFSLEQANLLDGDALFLARDSGEEASEVFRMAVESPVFQSLEVVKAGHVYLVDQETWITLRGYGAAEVILDDIERYLVNGELAPELLGS